MTHTHHDHFDLEQPPRRALLRLFGAGGTAMGLGALGGLAAWPCAAAAASGAPDTSARLVVVMLRGALDGLAAVPAVGDPAWAELCGAQRYRTGATDATAAPLPLDSTFALHPALAEMHRWYMQREMLVVHAVASPYRERSHFDAQQMLETGSDKPFALNTGWLGRALQARQQAAVALETALPLGLRGADLASSWSPERPTKASDDTLARMARLFEGDPALAKNWALATGNSRMNAMSDPAGGMQAGGQADGWETLLQQAGRFLTTPNGPRVAWLDTNGWDTHSQQEARLGRQLSRLDQALASLKTSLAGAWAHTTVLVVTEFGRTAVPNGSGGSDHGTAGAAFLAGGSVAGGRVWADWPGLGGAQLLAGRDLRPTLDLRGLIASVAERQFGFSGAAVRQDIVPGAPIWRAALWRT
jgi:uncharacterized protein (DUF1501 family)